MVLRDVRTILDAAADDRDALRDRVAPLIVLTVVEIAVLDRETDAAADRTVRTYGNLIAVALRFEGEAWEAIALWHASAPDHLDRFARRWSDHMVRAERHSESRYHHDKIVDLDRIGIALGLSRARIREVFGAAGCSLAPIKVRQGRFTLEEAADIRALSRRTGYSREYIGDIALTAAPEAFSDLMLVRELALEPADVIDRHRTLPHMSDLQISRSIQQYGGSSKPGPKPKANTLKAQINAVAGLRRVSFEKIRRQRSSLKANVTRDEGPKTTECAVALTPNSCRVDPEFVRSVIPEFSPSFSPGSGVGKLTIKGVEITDPWLRAMADVPWYEGRRKTYAHQYGDLDLVARWYQATRGVTPTRELMRKWAERGKLAGYNETARQWAKEQEIQAREAEKAAETITTTTIWNGPDDAVGPFRGEPDQDGEVPALAPALHEEGEADAARS